MFTRFGHLFRDLAGDEIPFARFHEEIWEWAWSLEAGVRVDPLVAILPRGGGKSTNAELVTIATGDRGTRNYVLYVSGTQDQADDHVLNISNLLESPEIEARSPQLAERRVGKYGHSKGWRRNRLSTASGFTVDGIGLDAAARGAKLDQFRPDLIIFDDIDDEQDTELKISKKIKSITRKLIPAGSTDLAVLAVQNLVHCNSVFTRMVDGRADFLARRKLIGPHRAIDNLTWEKVGDRVKITGGQSTWAGLSIATCQSMIDDMGLVAFLEECQHEQASSEGTIVGDVWRESVHVLAPFPIPRNWLIFRSFDYGYSRPFSVGWWARSPGGQAPNGRMYPAGTMFRIFEWYGWNGKPNQGCRMLAKDIAVRILDFEKRLGLAGRVRPGPADSSIWEGTNGNCVATDMAGKGCLWVPADKSSGSRINGARIIRGRLEASAKTPMEAPGLFVFNCCKHFMRTVPHLPKDPLDPDDAWTEGEDHVWDESRYGVTAVLVPIETGSTIGMY